MDNNTIANRLVNISAQIGSVVAARAIAAAKQDVKPVVRNTRTIRRRWQKPLPTIAEAVVCLLPLIGQLNGNTDTNRKVPIDPQQIAQRIIDTIARTQGDSSSSSGDGSSVVVNG